MTRRFPKLWRRHGDGAWGTFFTRAGRQGGYSYGRAGKVYMVGNNGETGVWDPVTRVLTEQTTTGKVCGNVAQAIGTAPWFHSTGAALITAKPSADSGLGLYRTTDWVTWTKVLDLRTDLGYPEDPSKVVSLTEMDNGWIVGCTYGTHDTDDAKNSSAIIRSKDAGVTWEQLLSFDRATYHPRHMHSVVWDKYRGVLWAMGGDGLNASKIGYSTDYGDTFNAWATTWQCTGFLPLPSGVILISDHNSNSYALHRVPGVTLADLLAQTVTTSTNIAYDPITQTPLHRAGLTRLEAGFSWWGWYDDTLRVAYAAFNSVTDPGHLNQELEGVLAASCEEDGSASCPTWVPIDWASASWGGDNAQASPPNPYDTQWDGWHYMNARLANGNASQAWRVIPPDFVIHVDQTRGTDVGSGTVDDPINYWPGGGFPRGRRVKLLADWNGPCDLSAAGMVVDRNGFALGSAVTGTLDVDEAFTSGAAPTNWTVSFSGTGSVTPDWASTSPTPTSGAYAVKCVAGAANATYSLIRRLTAGLPSVAVGEDYWVAVNAYIDEATLAGYAEFLAVVNHCNIRVKSIANREGASIPQFTFYSADNLEYAGDPWAPVPIPLQQWFRFLCRIRASSYAGDGTYNGEVDLWVNGQQALSLRGIRTRYDSSGFGSFYLGPRNKAAASGVRTWIFDDCKAKMGAGAFHPLKPTTYSMTAGARQLVLPEGAAA